MTKDETKGYCAYIIAKLGVRTDDERLSVIGEIGLILNKRYPQFEFKRENQYDKITVAEVRELLTQVLEYRRPDLVRMRNYNYLLITGFTELKSPSKYYGCDKWLSKPYWMYEADELIAKGLSKDEILNAMSESISISKVSKRNLNHYLIEKGVK